MLKYGEGGNAAAVEECFEMLRIVEMWILIESEELIGHGHKSEDHRFEI